MRAFRKVGGEGFEPPKAFRQLIYSQPPLATWLTAQENQVASSGADDGNRTRNLPLTRRLLCRLSYVGTPFRRRSDYTKGFDFGQGFKAW